MNQFNFKKKKYRMNRNSSWLLAQRFSERQLLKQQHQWL